MEKKYISDILNNGQKGHQNLDYLDVDINDDNLMFIDPMLIECQEDAWFVEADKTIRSFFDELYIAFRNRDNIKKNTLLSHAGEQNGTRLGYGNGYNGKGNTMQGLLHTFSPLDELLNEIRTIDRAIDLPVLLPGFSEDGLSDMLTNIIHDNLNEFTMSQLKKCGLEGNYDLSYWTWNRNIRKWEHVTRLSFCVHGKELLLVPKQIVRRNYLFSTDQYFRRIILERMRNEDKYVFNGKPISKKDVLKMKRFSGEHWQYDETIAYTRENNDALDDYHRELPLFYLEEGRIPTDEDLDNCIYS